MSSANSSAEVLDIEHFIDRHKVSAYQWTILALCFLIVAADGFDTAAAGFVAPAAWRMFSGFALPTTGTILAGCLSSQARAMQVRSVP